LLRFWFLIDPTIAATNRWAEQAIRPAVVNRKVWDGNRNSLGAQTRGSGCP
jgi:transposase